MKKFLLIIGALMVFTAFNYGVYKNEKIKSSGDVLYLEIAPLDPRSLMQGDYMQFAYATTRGKACENNQTRGYVVVEKGKDNIGSFKRCYMGEQIGFQEKLFRYNISFDTIQIMPNSFMFQEGLAPLYQKAKYAVFKFSGEKNYLLVALADGNLQTIGYENEHKEKP